MNIDHTGWFCHGCKRKGNAVTFLAEHENTTIQQATTWLRERFGAGSPDPDAFSIKAWLDRFYLACEEKKALPEADVILDEDVNLEFAIDWKLAMTAPRESWPQPMLYMLERGFDQAILDEYEIGYDEIWNRITIPVRDVAGRLIGFKGRAWDEKSKQKYLAIGSEKHGFAPYKKSHVIFGMDRVLNYWHQTQPEVCELVVVEGELNKIAMEQMGIENVGAVSGSDFSPAQALIVRRYADAVTVFLDSDQSGFDGTQMIIERLQDYMPIRVVPDHQGDAADYMLAGDESSVRRLLQEAESVTGILLASKIQ